MIFAEFARLGPRAVSSLCRRFVPFDSGRVSPGYDPSKMAGIWSGLQDKNIDDSIVFQPLCTMLEAEEERIDAV